MGGGNDDEFIDDEIEVLLERNNNKADILQFQDNVNACIAKFNELIKGEFSLIFHEEYGIWMHATIISLELYNSCDYEATHYFGYRIGKAPRNYQRNCIVSPRNVRVDSMRSCLCGARLPMLEFEAHRDPAVHLGYALTRNYLCFLANYEGIEATVHGQKAKLVDACRPWTDGNVKFRLKMMNSRNEIQESSQNIYLGHYQCKVCRKVLSTDEIENHLEIHFNEIPDLEKNATPFAILAKNVSEKVDQFFDIFERELKDQDAIFYQNGWSLVTLTALRMSESGGASYLIRKSDGIHEWVTTANVRFDYQINIDGIYAPVFKRRDDQERYKAIF
ncbi:uncharacterized protein LOC129580193 isoform X2 [Sitodiplosis mosellana]|nr:uncharacterized protein LOC129580193 isoform X2 [Sitodiplosis mosellana]